MRLWNRRSSFFRRMVGCSPPLSTRRPPSHADYSRTRATSRSGIVNTVGSAGQPEARSAGREPRGAGQLGRRCLRQLGGADGHGATVHAQDTRDPSLKWVLQCSHREVVSGMGVSLGSNVACKRDPSVSSSRRVLVALLRYSVARQGCPRNLRAVRSPRPASACVTSHLTRSVGEESKGSVTGIKIASASSGMCRHAESPQGTWQRGRSGSCETATGSRSRCRPSRNRCSFLVHSCPRAILHGSGRSLSSRSWPRRQASGCTTSGFAMRARM